MNLQIGGQYRSAAVQNAAEEQEQLLKILHRLRRQEVLLVRGVEDDDAGHRHLTAGGRANDGDLNQSNDIYHDLVIFAKYVTYYITSFP